MPAPTDRLAALIGLSQGGSPCFPLPEAPEGSDLLAITASMTGYYLDMLEGLSFRTATGNGASDLYERMQKARTLAALNLRTQLKAGTSSKARYVESGSLGGASAGRVGVAGPLTLRTQYHEAGALLITSVRLATTQTQVDVPLLLDGAQVAMLTATNAVSQPVSILIPLDGLTHTLEAQLAEGNLPLENKLHCPGCSGGGPWGKAVARNLSGVTTATLAQGFTLAVSEVCAAPIADVVCYAAAQYEELRNYMGQAMMYTAGALFVADLLTDAKVDRYTMLEPKTLPALGARYEAKAAEAVKWLIGPEALGGVQHPCYTCQAPAWHPTKTSVA